MINRAHPLAGLCYVLSEAFYHLYGQQFKLKPMHARYYGLMHWWLVDPSGRVIDPTAEQFTRPFPYHKDRSSGFLTKQSCQRTREILKILEGT